MIVGTAGHIDHGKTALVRALTGIDTDRLKEEKARGITIDLGFAYLATRHGKTLGFVDVPGHEKFIHNMLAGAGGIDFVLLTVAADDGVMPQTREHLAIVDLLGVGRGIVALTKVDLVSPEQRQTVAAQIADALDGTALAGSEIVPVSSVSGEGLDALRERLFARAQAVESAAPKGRFRLAVDRSFSLTGVGTVVTGTVLSGTVAVADHVRISPSGMPARVRSIHAQNRAADRGQAGERCALNLAGDGIGKDAIRRGDMVLDPELHAPTDRIDATLRVLGSEPKPIAHWMPVRLHHAAAEVGARVVLLGEGPIAPGAQARIQLVLDRPVAAAAGAFSTCALQRADAGRRSGWRSSRPAAARIGSMRLPHCSRVTRVMSSFPPSHATARSAWTTSRALRKSCALFASGCRVPSSRCRRSAGMSSSAACLRRLQRFTPITPICPGSAWNVFESPSRRGCRRRPSSMPCRLSQRPSRSCSMARGSGCRTMRYG